MDKNALYALVGAAVIGGLLLLRKKPAPPNTITVHFISNPAGAAVFLKENG